MKVFLGGTCNESTWRDELIPLLKVDYFNPVVEDWTPECQAQEIQERETCDIVLYVITPEMIGVYSIAEVIDDSNKRPDKTVFCVLDNQKAQYTGVRGFNPNQMRPSYPTGMLKSLRAVESMARDNGAKICYSLREIAEYVNSLEAEK